MQKINGVAVLLAAAVLAGAAPLAEAQEVLNWNVAPAAGTASWANTANWTVIRISNTATSMALVDNGGTATIAAGNNVSDRSGSGNIVIGSSGSNYAGDNGGNGFVTMSGGTLSGNGGAGPYAAEYLGYGGGSGIFTQSGGINAPYQVFNSYNYASVQLGPVVGGYGEYNMSGGSLGANAIYVGATDALPICRIPAQACSTKPADRSASLASAGTIRRLG